MLLIVNALLLGWLAAAEQVYNKVCRILRRNLLAQTMLHFCIAFCYLCAAIAVEDGFQFTHDILFLLSPLVILEETTCIGISESIYACPVTDSFLPLVRSKFLNGLRNEVFEVGNGKVMGLEWILPTLTPKTVTAFQ